MASEPGRQRGNHFRELFVLSLYSLLSLGLTYPLIFHLASAVPNDIGDPLLNTWILAWVSHALLTQPLALFEANIFYPLPQTLAYSEHLFSTALLALPLQLISGEPVVAYNLSLLATFPLAAFGMYLLSWRWTGQRNAAFIAGLVFGFAPYRFAAIAHLQLLTFQWLPFALLFLDKVIRHPRASTRHYVALGLFLLLQSLASWYLALYTGLILALYLLFSFLPSQHSPRSAAPQPLLYRLLLTLLGTGLLLLPMAGPYLALVDELRQARPLSLALSLAAAPTDFIAAAPFNTLFGPLTAPWRDRPGFTEENTLFLGLVAGLLALVALISGAARQRRWLTHHAPRPTFYTLLLILSLSLLLTFPAPYTLLAQLLPAATVVRVPPRWIIPGLFALAGLAGLGYALIRARLRRLQGRGLLFVCTCLLVAESLSVPVPLAAVENRGTLRPAYGWLAQQPPDFALIELPLHSAPAPEFPEVKRLYASTLGWWPLVNGYSGYTPPRQPLLAQALASFPDPSAVTTLQSLEEELAQAGRLEPPARLYLLVHPGEAPFERSRWETQGRWLAERQPGLLPVGQFEGDYLYEVRPQAVAAPLASFGRGEGRMELLGVIPRLPEEGQKPIGAPPFAPALLLYWRAPAGVSLAYTVFIHLRAADGFVRSQADGPPVSGHYPTSRWQPGEIIQDIHPLPPEEDFSGVDHLAIGLYDPATGERLPAFGQDGQPLKEKAVLVPMR